MIPLLSCVGPRVSGATACFFLVCLLAHLTAFLQAGLWRLAVAAPAAAAVSLPGGMAEPTLSNLHRSSSSRKTSRVGVIPISSKEAHVAPHADGDSSLLEQARAPQQNVSSQNLGFLQVADGPQPAVPSNPLVNLGSTLAAAAPAQNLSPDLSGAAQATPPPAPPAAASPTTGGEAAAAGIASTQQQQPGQAPPAGPTDHSDPSAGAPAAGASPPATEATAAASEAAAPAPAPQTQSAVNAAADPTQAAALPAGGTLPPEATATPAAATPESSAPAPAPSSPTPAETAAPASPPSAPAEVAPTPAAETPSAPAEAAAVPATDTPAPPAAGAPSTAMPASSEPAAAAGAPPAEGASMGAASDIGSSSSRAKLAYLLSSAPGVSAESLRAPVEAAIPRSASAETTLSPAGTDALAAPLSAPLDSVGQSVAATLTPALSGEIPEPLDKRSCMSHCSCTPVVVISSVLFGVCCFSVLITSIMMGSLFSRGFFSSSFFFGGGHAILAAAFFGLAIGMICGGIVAGCWPAALSFGGGTLAFACGIVLLGRRGAWLGAIGGVATGGSIAGLVNPTAFPISLGCLMGLLMGIVIGFAPLFRDLKMNSRYIRHGLHAHDDTSSRASQRDLPKSTDSLSSQRVHRMTPSTAASRSASGLKLRSSPSRTTTESRGSRNVGLHEDQIADNLASPRHSVDSGTANNE